MKNYKISKNATRKMARINVTFDDLEVAYDKGQKIHRTGAVFYFLGKNDLPNGKEFEKLNGLTVIVKDTTVVTVYKNKKVLHNIKQRMKRNNWKKFEGIGKPDFVYCFYHPTFNFCECSLNMGLAI